MSSVLDSLQIVLILQLRVKETVLVNVVLVFDLLAVRQLFQILLMFFL